MSRRTGGAAGPVVPAELRRTVLREAGVVAVLTVLVLVASVRWDVPTRVQVWSRSSAVPVDQLVFVLAASHLLMMGFGARRARQLKVEAAGRRAAEIAVLEQANRDPVTGLSSLPAFLTALAADRAQTPGGGEVAVVLLDIDRFAAVNDTLGHETGNALLVALAGRLRASAPRGTVLARLGGDMFGALLPGELAGQAAGFAAALHHSISRPIAVDDLLLDVDLSIGVARGHGPTPEDLLRRADMARVAAKRSSSGIAHHDPAVHVFDPGQLSLHADLRRAVRQGGLSVYYQPKARLSDGRVSGVEALVRWHHPERGLLLPGAFIDLAEQTALIGPLTDLVLGRALEDCHRWREAGRAFSVAVNVSPRLLQDLDFPGRVAALLRQHQVDPDELELEITETAALEDPRRAMTVLSHLELLGVSLSVDDFGTGHASLTHLVELPVSCLKIDRSFVASMCAVPAQRAIVASTVDLAHSLGLIVVAEGVESREQWQLLHRLGCDLAQGYWLAAPVPASELPDRVAEFEDRQLRTAVPTVPEPRVPSDR